MRSRPATRRSIYLLLILVALVGCTGRHDRAPAQARAATEAVPAEAPAPARSEHPGTARADTRMTIRTGSLQLLCDDTGEASSRANRIARAHGGFVSDSRAAPADGDRLNRWLTLRIPEGSFDAAFEELRGLGKKILTEETSSQDVTEEYVDLRARLHNLEATEEELLVILREIRENARKAAEVLEIYEAVNEIRGQIEQTRGRIQQLERQVSLATIELALFPVLPERPVIEREAWSGGRTARNAARMLVGALQGLADLALYVTIFILPVVLIVTLPIAAILWIVWWLIRRRRGPQG